MTVELATFVADLQPVNPPSTDPRSQGDDHLRLIKQVLQNTFGGASRQWQVPSAKAISANYSVVKADGESTIYVSTASGAVTATLPSLVAGDAGWKVRFIKTSSDANPIFIAPPTGTINSGGVAGLSKARRCIPGITIETIWDGAAWFSTRATALPIGSCIEYHGSALPAGYEWPNGQTLSSAANYPEYNAVRGGLTTGDKRGYTSIALDNLGGVSAGRLPSGFIAQTTLGAGGGVDGVTLSTAHMPSHFHPCAISDPGHTHGSNAAINGGGSGTPGPFTAPLNAPGGATINTVGTGITINGGSPNGVNTTYSAGGGAIHSNLQPSIMVSQILVVE